MDLMDVYASMLHRFGQQHWWPVQHEFYPKEFEICVGAILTQNTNWRNVEKALAALSALGLTSPESIASVTLEELGNAVRPSGFYKQKAERLKIFSEFILSFGSFRRFRERVTRQEMLNVKGIGPETADSILLYALSRPVFVIDAYTKRIFKRLGYGSRKGYDEWREFFERHLPKDPALYMEFHALIVELAKRHCRAKPLCSNCPLIDTCPRKI